MKNMIIELGRVEHLLNCIFNQKYLHEVPEKEREKYEKDVVNKLYDETYKIVNSKKYEQIAQLCHIVNTAYCKSIGEDNYGSWYNTPQEIRDSILKGVELHMRKETTPEESHKNWVDRKIKDGWVYGPVKDFKKKTHPCLVDYNDLPQE